MKFKQFIILLLSFSILLAISCSNEDTTGTGDSVTGTGKTGGTGTDGVGAGTQTKTVTISDYAGDWYTVSSSGETNYLVFTINTNGSVIIVGSETTIDAASITRNSDTNYSVKYDNTTTYEFAFVSDSQLTYKGDDYETTLRKKEQ